ncbi:hypothetical protein HH310_08150 [Actinoplanes sp. TBRC 11911]|uniref:hypothetical protein n=1 Tax=Actinoplanes sp. TBRC 11911 TaxID=2729386 RepID=UPI00145CACB3|nr:hypothetical protein [Actinoplanes sp. TBRC 11911]NMO51158.1 hypothetical protein [Actinoplanes sp. TBRC 11911]
MVLVVTRVPDVADGVDDGFVGSIKTRVSQVIFVGFVVGGALAVTEMWQEVADLRANGVHATARVAALTTESRHRHEALLVLPGGEELTTDVGFPGGLPRVGDHMDVIYDPADPTIMDKGDSVRYAGPVFFTLLEAAGILFVIRWAYSRITRRPLVPDGLAHRGFWPRRPLPPVPPRFVPGAARKRKPSRRRR